MNRIGQTITLFLMKTSRWFRKAFGMSWWGVLVEGGGEKSWTFHPTIEEAYERMAESARKCFGRTGMLASR